MKRSRGGCYILSNHENMFLVVSLKTYLRLFILFICWQLVLYQKAESQHATPQVSVFLDKQNKNISETFLFLTWQLCWMMQFWKWKWSNLILVWKVKRSDQWTASAVPSVPADCWAMVIFHHLHNIFSASFNFHLIDDKFFHVCRSCGETYFDNWFHSLNCY